MDTHSNQTRKTQAAIRIDEFDATAQTLCPRQEVIDLLESAPKRFDPGPLWKIIRAYETGAMGAAEAIYALEAYGLLTSPREVMDAFCIAKRVEAGLPIRATGENAG